MNPRTRLSPLFSLLLVIAVAVGCASSGGSTSTTKPVGATKKTSKKLGIAARHGTVADLEAALATGENLNGPGDSKNTPLHEAALFDNAEAAKWLIAHGAIVNSVDEDLDTPLHFAADKSSKKVAAILLQSGAKVDSVDEDGETPLYMAAEAGDPQTVQMLLDAGADPNKRNNDGESPLSVARENNQTAIIPLLERGRKPGP